MSQKSPCVKQMTEPKHRQPRFRQHRPPPTSEHADKMIDLSFHSQTMLTISCQTTEKVPPYITFLIIILKAIMSLYVYTPKNSFYQNSAYLHSTSVSFHGIPVTVAVKAQVPFATWLSSKRQLFMSLLSHLPRRRKTTSESEIVSAYQQRQFSHFY